MVRAGGRLTKGNTLTIQVAPDGESTLDLRVGEAIAEGGSGSVFEGRDPRGRAVRHTKEDGSKIYNLQQQ